MCSSEELIHDARQVDLEEMIMTNETPMYLVPGRLTDEQRQSFVEAMDCGETAEDAIAAIGTPIQPCADVETVGYANGALLGAGHAYRMISPVACSTERTTRHFDTPLVRRTDMEAQIARVAAEKDVEIARLRAALAETKRKAVGYMDEPSACFFIASLNEGAAA
ncbi:hypothetical protein [Komagataeibacter europaeus]|uniref:hypothetical protein n=1 Tax=Komagataeibacter europaeus TaxID=33995 RepID=UPI00035E9189|nr:hypothetical protein [Komagataeibacter europaeus]GBQ44992.1 hypothetical protein AA18890_2335 [Komagataeibacter europaeus LMG 18890]